MSDWTQLKHAFHSPNKMEHQRSISLVVSRGDFDEPTIALVHSSIDGIPEFLGGHELGVQEW